MNALLSCINVVIDPVVRLLPQFLGWLAFWADAFVVFLRADWQRTTLFGLLSCLICAEIVLAALLFAALGKPLMTVVSILLLCYIYSVYERSINHD